MNVLPAYCGLVCETCPIYLATREPDAIARNRMRAGIARICREHYGWELTAAEVNRLRRLPDRGRPHLPALPRLRDPCLCP